MRILYLSHCCPYPPNKGDRIRAFHQLRHLGRRHEVHLVALGDERDIQHHGDLDRFCRTVALFPLRRATSSVRSAIGALGSKPLTIAYFRSAAASRRVRKLASSSSFDLVFAYTSAMAPYAMALPSTRRVLDMVDVDSDKWAQFSRFTRFPQRNVYRLESRRMQAYEAELCRSFDRVLLTTRREVETLASFSESSKVSVVRNGICFESFRRLDLPRSSTPMLVFTGQMDYFANIDGVCHFAHHVFPVLRSKHPDLQFVIVGRSPAPEVAALQRIAGITVTGAVSDVKPFLARATVFVAPLRIARGIQNKALEAMACTLPVVCTPPVMGGLADGGFRSSQHLLVAGDDTALVRAISTLLDDHDLRRRLSEAARKQLKRAYSWDQAMAGLEQILLRVAETSPSAETAVIRESSVA